MKEPDQDAGRLHGGWQDDGARLGHGDLRGGWRIGPHHTPFVDAQLCTRTQTDGVSPRSNDGMLTRKGPILTLTAGVLLAVVVMLLNVDAKRDRDAKRAAASAATPTASATRPAAVPTTPPPTTAPPSPGPQVTYAGSAGGGSIAIAVKDGHAVAYLCDGR